MWRPVARLAHVAEPDGASERPNAAGQDLPIHGLPNARYRCKAAFDIDLPNFRFEQSAVTKQS